MMIEEISLLSSNDIKLILNVMLLSEDLPFTIGVTSYLTENGSDVVPFLFRSMSSNGDINEEIKNNLIEFLRAFGETNEKVKELISFNLRMTTNEFLNDLINNKYHYGRTISFMFYSELISIIYNDKVLFDFYGIVEIFGNTSITIIGRPKVPEIGVEVRSILCYHSGEKYVFWHMDKYN